MVALIVLYRFLTSDLARLWGFGADILRFGSPASRLVPSPSQDAPAPANNAIRLLGIPLDFRSPSERLWA